MNLIRKRKTSDERRPDLPPLGYRVSSQHLEKDRLAEMKAKLEVLPEPQDFRTLDLRHETRYVAPRSFAAAKLIADHYTDGRSVILDLHTAEDRLARRLVDFCSGFCYTSGGSMERVAERLLVICPQGVQLTRAELDSVVERFSVELVSC